MNEYDYANKYLNLQSVYTAFEEARAAQTNAFEIRDTPGVSAATLIQATLQVNQATRDFATLESLLRVVGLDFEDLLSSDFDRWLQEQN